MGVPDISCYRFIYVWHLISKTVTKNLILFSKSVLIPSLLRAMNLQCLSVILEIGLDQSTAVILHWSEISVSGDPLPVLV